VNDEAPSEDLTILAALEALERGLDAPDGPVRSDETAEMLARLYAEALGLIPYELAPVEPAAGLKARVMSRLAPETSEFAGDDTQPSPAAAVEPVRVAAPAPVVPLRHSQEMRAQETTRTPRMAVAGAASRPVPPRRWPLALAATLAFALLGLSVWLYSQLGAQRAALGTQRATIDDLRHELSRERSRSEGAIAKVREIEADSLDLHEKFSLVTSPAVQVSPLRPMGRPPLQPDARGVLFVAADHQHWYMALQGLQPAEAGKAYKLWFVAGQGMVSAGSFSAKPGAPVELSSKHMPAGTRGGLVTLENDPQAPAPAGPQILRSAAFYQIS
jgi:Anti-sigma-K factor rskA